MDLRRRLLGWLGLLLGGLLSMALLIQLWSLRDDIDTEIAASSRLVELLLAIDAGAPDLDARLADAGLRHLSISLDGSPSTAAAAAQVSKCSARLSRAAGSGRFSSVSSMPGTGWGNS